MQKQQLRTMLLIAAILLAVSVVSAIASDAQAYQLGPEDVITVTVTRHPEFSGDFLIPVDGRVNLPAVGEITASGLTVEDVTSDIVAKLKDRLVNPEVTVSLKAARMQRVYVLGAVDKPGLYDYKPGWRITEAVAAAGGISTGVEPSDCKARLLSTDGNKHSVDVSSAMTGSTEANLEIRNGDVLTIETEATMPVYVVGKVKTPGLYRLTKSNPGIMEALTLAGGTLDEAATSKISITHVDGAVEKVDLTCAALGNTEKPMPKLQSGDLVLVPETTSRIAVLGFVKSPGFYVLRDGQKLMLTDALGLAGGSDNKRGGISSIAIVRTKDGKQEKLTFNLHKFLKSGDLAENPQILAGDVVFVPETNKLDWQLVYQAVSTVGMLVNPFIN